MSDMNVITKMCDKNSLGIPNAINHLNNSKKRKININDWKDIKRKC